MFSPEEQQIEICLLKSNLEKIGDDLLVQNSAMPALDAENEQKYRETMSALRVARSLNAERERLNLENVKLTAKRMQLKRQCDDITKTLERARANRDDLAGSLKREEQEMELLIRKYEDSLREKAERFRKTSSFYNEDEMKAELEKANNSIKDLEDEMTNHQNIVDELKRTLDELQAEVPENLLAILGKSEMDEEVKTITAKYDAVLEKRNHLLNTSRK
ncbi:coiled-coil domain-containing protein 18-like [Ostrinia furnacalis]|uniref:coiled-coil domain-containing protein 18-like n=1 Tax=Ostrinia furnacalis TaxID=93504 RepID=UPI0010392A48|nr:coiled-coil domain-containing protein 18-like [Ostrinia furnacalis]